MGFWTICGDVGDYGMVQKVFKGLELYDIARVLQVPDEVLNAIPDDGLGIMEGGDEAQLGLPYNKVDEVMIRLLQMGYDPDVTKNLPSELPQIEAVSEEQIRALWNRSVGMRYKRKGSVVLEREELALPGVMGIEV